MSQIFDFTVTKNSGLFGGAISLTFPDRFKDLSNVRQAPDHQEAFSDPDRDESIIVELLDLKHKVTDENSAVCFLQDLATEQDAEGGMGFTYPVRAYFLENILETTQYRLTPFNQIDDYGREKVWKMQKQTRRKRKSQIASAVEESVEGADLVGYSHRTQDSLSCWNHDSIGFNLIEHVLCHICKNESPGAILVFMAGWEDINSLKDQLQAHPLLGHPYL